MCTRLVQHEDYDAARSRKTYWVNVVPSGSSTSARLTRM